MEAFSCMFKKATERGIFRGISLPNNGPTISHLLYVDDVILVGEWSKENVLNITRLLRCFYLVSGLHINFCKSKLMGVKVTLEEVSNLVNLMGCKPDVLPCSYLGLTIGANMNRISNWNSVLEAFDKRLSLWKAPVLSVGGRLTLLKAVMETLPTYFFSLFKAPYNIIDQLEAKRGNFFWVVTKIKGKFVG
ncbi:uncharacterized protein LOC143593863 [Bidens hawaiensis]|uniref:uncharacterized protein LOC143593863 n=1 Tax=Bidens hawaiensis TaxID=980011 RepID=UPI00404B0A9B